MGIIYKNGIPYGNQPSTDAVAMIEPSEEASATSAHAYAAGDHFIYNGTLYRATAAIAIGDTITPDTNCVATTVMTEVEAGGGGGGGTSDYTQLSNKPQINGNTLTGNKTGADLGLVNAVTGKQLSTEDYTTAEKTKLAGIEAQANKTVIDDTLTNTGEAADAKAVGDAIGDIEDITGDGQLSGFTATDLTGAANELKNTLNQLETTTSQLDQNMAYVESGNTASRTYAYGQFISWKGTLYTVSDTNGIASGVSFSNSNLAAVVDGYGDLCGGFNAIMNHYKTVDITNSITWDITPEAGLSYAYRIDRLIIMSIMIRTPSTVTTDRLIATLPFTVSGVFASAIYTAWSGAVAGLVRAYQNRVYLVSNEWKSNTRVSVNIAFIID